MTVKNSSALWDVRSPATRSGYTALVNPIRHVFLTRPKGIGKSTLIQTVLSRFCGKARRIFYYKNRPLSGTFPYRSSHSDRGTANPNRKKFFVCMPKYG